MGTDGFGDSRVRWLGRVEGTRVLGKGGVAREGVGG